MVLYFGYFVKKKNGLFTHMLEMHSKHAELSQWKCHQEEKKNYQVSYGFLGIKENMR